MKTIAMRLSFRAQPEESAPQNLRWIREGIRAYLIGTVLSFLVCVSLNAALVASLVEYTPLSVAGGALIAAGSDFMGAVLFFSLARLKFRRVRILKNKEDGAYYRERD